MGRYDSQRTSEFPFFLLYVFHGPLTPRSTQLFQGRGLLSPEARWKSRLISSPAGRSGKAIALAVHCPMYEIKKAERGRERRMRREKLWYENRVKEKLKEEGETELRTQMTDKEKRQRLSDGGARRKPETERRIPALSHHRPPPPHHPLIPGMMSAFIDFVKPFPMLLPMCLQDSKSRSIRGGGLWGEIRGKHPSCRERRPLWPSQRQLCSFLPHRQHFMPHTHTLPHRELTWMPLWGPLSSWLSFLSVLSVHEQNK